MTTIIGTPASSGTSWHYTTKELVANWSGVNITTLQDAWCDWVEGLIENFTGTSYKGVQTFTEIHDGDGTNSLFLQHGPLVAVQSMTIAGGTYTASDYQLYDHHIELIAGHVTEMTSSLYIPALFPVGVGNIHITYTAQTAVVPPEVQLAATQMVSAIAMVAAREGADSSLKYSRVTRIQGDAQTITEQFGLQGSLVDIMKKYLKPKVLAL